MLGSNLSALYGVKKRRLNEQMEHNISEFDELSVKLACKDIWAIIFTCFVIYRAILFP